MTRMAIRINYSRSVEQIFVAGDCADYALWSSLFLGMEITWREIKLLFVFRFLSTPSSHVSLKTFARKMQTCTTENYETSVRVPLMTPCREIMRKNIYKFTSEGLWRAADWGLLNATLSVVDRLGKRTENDAEIIWFGLDFNFKIFHCWRFFCFEFD